MRVLAKRTIILCGVLLLLLMGVAPTVAQTEENNQTDPGGIALFPALYEPTDLIGNYDLTVVNQENVDVTVSIFPWLFEMDEGRLKPQTKKQVETFDLSYIIPSKTEFALKRNSEQTIKIDYDLNQAEHDLFHGVVTKIGTKEGLGVASSIASTILYRGDPAEETVEAKILSKPRMTFNRDIIIDYSIKNTGNYILKPSGQIEITRNGKTTVKNIQITSEINNNLIKNEEVKGTLEFQIPEKDKFWKEIGKYEFKLNVNSNSGNNFTDSVTTYYFNPLIFLIGLLLLVLIISFLYFLLRLITHKRA